MLLSLCLRFAFASSFLAGQVVAQTLEIPGSGPPTELLRALADAFNRTKASQRIEIPPVVGIAGALEAVKTGAALARMQRPLNSDEKKLGFRQIVIARQALVFVTGSDVSLTNLSRTQLADAFGGKVNNWKDLGGSSAPVRVLYREESAESTRTLRRTLPEFASLQFTTEGRQIHVESALSALMQRFHWSLGWMSLNNAQAAKGLRILALDGVAPTALAVSTGEYPLYLDVVLIYRTQPSGVAKEFLDFIVSPQGRSVIQTLGALPMTSP
jgi:phosphate transport system substrate-binding protein